MKLLLIGFSMQSAGVLATLINRYYPDCQVQIIERVFGDNLRLSLPILKEEHQNASAMIINLDGVGMIGFLPKRIKELQDFVGVRAAIFTTKAVLADWRAAKVLPEGFAIFVRSPYDQQAMVNALKTLFSVAPTASSRASEFYQANSSTEFSLENSSIAPQKTNHQKRREHPLHAIIDRHFDLKQKEILHDMLSISLAQTPIKITAGSQTLYMNQHKNLALVVSKERIMDYCAVVNNFQVLDDVLAVEPVSEEEFNEISLLSPNNGYQKMALSTLLWQMYSKILPSTMPIQEHALRLRMRYMPSFYQIDDVPDCARSLLSLALVEPKTIDELYEAAEGQMDRAALHRIFLLAILVGVADNDILQQSFYDEEEEFAEDATERVAQHEEGESTQSSGFLNGLMKVLNADVGDLVKRR